MVSDLTQAEADLLLGMEKRAATDEAFEYPYHGGSIHVPLQSPDKREPRSVHLEDPWETLLDFMDFCHITLRPVIQRGLFT